jgi:hypothetical protein
LGIKKVLFVVVTSESLSNQYSALVKPFRKLIDDGKPIGKIAFLFYRQNNSYFILGSFAFTDRVIFFPGITFSRLIHTPDGIDLPKSKMHYPEHFTNSDNSPKVRQVKIRSTNGIDDNTGSIR